MNLIELNRALKQLAWAHGGRAGDPFTPGPSPIDGAHRSNLLPDLR